MLEGRAMTYVTAAVGGLVVFLCIVCALLASENKTLRAEKRELSTKLDASNASIGRLQTSMKDVTKRLNDYAKARQRMRDAAMEALKSAEAKTDADKPLVDKLERTAPADAPCRVSNDPVTQDVWSKM